STATTKVPQLVRKVRLHSLPAPSGRGRPVPVAGLRGLGAATLGHPAGDAVFVPPPQPAATSATTTAEATASVLTRAWSLRARPRDGAGGARRGRCRFGRVRLRSCGRPSTAPELPRGARGSVRTSRGSRFAPVTR